MELGGSKVPGLQLSYNSGSKTLFPARREILVGASPCGALWGTRDAMKSARACTYRRELDMATLVATRGRDFPLAGLESRLRCPRCGSRRIAVMFDVPKQPMRNFATE